MCIHCGTDDESIPCRSCTICSPPMKPLVNYKYPPIVAPRKMGRAVVEPINHPGHNGLVSNTKPVLTSPVVAIHSNGEFETENTYYAPEEL